MGARSRRSREEVVHELHEERKRLTGAVAALRAELGVRRLLRASLPALAAGAAGVGFVLGGGLRATLRLARDALRRAT